MAVAAWGDPLATPLLPPERAGIVETLNAAGEAVDPQAADDALVARLLGYASTELGQRVRPTAIDKTWAIEPTRRDVAAEFAAARMGGTLAAWLRALSPPAPGYGALQAAARRYRALVQAGGWNALPSGPVLKEGARDPQVAALRARLAVEGYDAPAPAQPELFDAPLKKALAAFELHHGLDGDGILDPSARAALNVPADERVTQIETNLERWRWLPHDLPADRIEVDIAGAQATLFRAGAPALSMKIIVGDPKHRTPMFASGVDSVVFNPPWNVPASITQAELLPKEARNPGYLARNNFTWVDGHLQQRPGPKSALGLIKFDLPSPFGVYLHDTPGKSAFQRSNRALSHGCMRVENPLDLAERLLAPQGWTDDSITRAIETRQTLRVGLKVHTPLFVVYRTVVVDAAGQADFRPDIYGWDHKLADALPKPPAPSAAADDATAGGVKLASAASPHPTTDCAQGADARS